MDNLTFYKIASMASIMAELAKEGEEICNAIKSEHGNIAANELNGFSTAFPKSEAAKYIADKAKIERELKAKNEELQKMF